MGRGGAGGLTAGAGETDAERLDRLLGAPDLAWLVARARKRIELGRPLSGSVTLSSSTPAQRAAAQRLLGRPARDATGLSVSLDAVDALLRRSGACPRGLAAAVVELTGPVTIHSEASAAEERAWKAAFAPLERAAAGRVELTEWLSRLRASGLVKRLDPDPDTARELLERLAAVVDELPASGEPLSAFAARVAGGAHSLDPGRPLATLALGAARALARLAPPAPGELPSETRREAWASAGVLCDELSSVVLGVGLPGDCATGSGRALLAAGAQGEPLWLTLRQLVRHPPAWGGALDGHAVHVCENPVVVALAADRFGPRCPPLVCTNGYPGAATMLLLRGLVAAGARLSHHGDFEWGGLAIGNVLHARLPIRPWRFGADTYVRLAARSSGPALAGEPVIAAWDRELEPVMSRNGRRIEEEVVVGELLDDLAAVAR